MIDTKETVAPDEMEKQLAWHNGVIIFDGETLSRHRRKYPVIQRKSCVLWILKFVISPWAATIKPTI